MKSDNETRVDRAEVIAHLHGVASLVRSGYTPLAPNGKPDAEMTAAVEDACQALLEVVAGRR